MLEWLPDMTQYSTAIMIAGIAILILLLCLVLYWLLRPSVRGRKGSRIGISEYHELDKTRRLVLVRRDDVEHLLLIGGGQDLVVEGDIGSPLTHVKHSEMQHNLGPLAPPVQNPATQLQGNFRPPRPPVFASRRPELRSVRNEDEQA